MVKIIIASKYVQCPYISYTILVFDGITHIARFELILGFLIVRTFYRPRLYVSELTGAKIDTSCLLGTRQSSYENATLFT